MDRSAKSLKINHRGHGGILIALLKLPSAFVGSLVVV